MIIQPFDMIKAYGYRSSKTTTFRRFTPREHMLSKEQEKDVLERSLHQMENLKECQEELSRSLAFFGKQLSNLLETKSNLQGIIDSLQDS